MQNDDYGSFLGQGFGFPPLVDKVSGRFIMSQGEDNIRESVELILMTGRGEQLMRPNFGCDLKRFIYEPVSYISMLEMEREIKRALNLWEPRITDINATVTPDAKDSSRMNIEVCYRIRSTNNPYNMVFPFYIQEGFVN